MIPLLMPLVMLQKRQAGANMKLLPEAPGRPSESWETRHKHPSESQ